MGELRQVAPATPESVGELRRAIGDFVRSHGAGDELVMAVQLATSEAMSNAVIHAFEDREEPGTLSVTATREDDAIAIVVTDDGSGMRPRTDSPGLGVGLPIMTRSSDSLRFRERPEGGTEVAMRFALEGGQQAA